MLKEKGFNEIKEEFVPKINQLLPGVLPRAVAGYGMLMWFTSKVCLGRILFVDIVSQSEGILVCTRVYVILKFV